MWDHLATLVQNLNRRMKDEEKQSGISPHMSEVDQVIMDIIEIEQASEVELKQNCMKKKDKIESERKQGEELKKKAMDKSGDTCTQKGKVHVKDGAVDDECEPKSKGRGRSGNNSSVLKGKRRGSQGNES